MVSRRQATDRREKLHGLICHNCRTLRRETAEDVSLDMDADDYLREEGVDSDSDSTFVPEGLDGDDEIDMNIAQ